MDFYANPSRAVIFFDGCVRLAPRNWVRHQELCHHQIVVRVGAPEERVRLLLCPVLPVFVLRKSKPDFPAILVVSLREEEKKEIGTIQKERQAPSDSPNVLQRTRGKP